MKLWEILVPTEKPASFPGKKRYFTKRYHKLWDAKVMALSNGLTILSPNKGSWISPEGQLFHERMIPVRIACSEEQIEEIMEITAYHYGQQAVMAYVISEKVLIRDFTVPSAA